MAGDAVFADERLYGLLELLIQIRGRCGGLGSGGDSQAYEGVKAP
jgi:hypothetical protein